MADRKISDLTALTTPATGDLIPIVDISEAAAADKNKSITVGELLRGAPDGTAAAPGIAFESDGGNGMFLGGTDILAFSTGGTQAVTIDASQRVGLGTSTPAAPLHILAESSADGALIQRWGYVQSDISNYYLTLKTAVSSGLVKYNFSMRNNGTDYDDVLILDRGNVGIGVTSPSEKLDINVSSTLGFSIGDDPANSAQLALRSYQGSTNNNVRSISYIGSDHRFQVGAVTGTTASEAVRIDTDGRLLVGTSTARSQYGVTPKSQVEGTDNTSSFGAIRNSNDTGGAYLLLGKSRGTATGSATIVQSDDLVGAVYFQGADGSDLEPAGSIECRIDGTPGANDMPGRLVFSTTADGASSPTERMRITNTGYIFASGNESGSNVNRIAPVTDDVGYLGDSGHRWQAVYATNGTIQTSDEREKTDIQDSILGADFIRSLRPVSYRWKTGGYETTFDEDGNRVDTPVPGVRNHYGFIAQEVKQACGNADFGGWLLEDLDDPNSKQSLRLHEFISPIVKALQEALDEIDTLKAKVAALEAQ